MKRKKLMTFALVSAGVILIDQVTKWVIKATMELNQTIEVLGNFFTISYILNSGMAFGLFDDNPSPLKRPLLIIISIIALAIIVYIFFSLPKKVKMSGIAMGLIFGGAIGNMINRIISGLVVDFLDFDFPNVSIRQLKIHMTRFPTFNVADTCVFIGVIILLVIIIVEGGRAEPSGA
jgi:signal peptidase II